MKQSFLLKLEIFFTIYFSSNWFLVTFSVKVISLPFFLMVKNDCMLMLIFKGCNSTRKYEEVSTNLMFTLCLYYWLPAHSLTPIPCSILVYGYGCRGDGRCYCPRGLKVEGGGLRIRLVLWKISMGLKTFENCYPESEKAATETSILDD